MTSRYRFTYTETPEEFIAVHRLATAQLPPARLRALLEATTAPTEALALRVESLRQAPFLLSERQTDRLTEAASAPLPRNFPNIAQSLGVTVLSWQDTDYPPALSLFDDAPPLLFVRGVLPESIGQSIAIVGSRRAMLYGRGQAERFARDFADNGLVVVSGGAAGIDTVAHTATLNAGGVTVAILGCGVDHAYPMENRSLFTRIVEQGGAVLSEYPIGTTPEPWRFPARNRIIAGLSRVTVVIESPKDSGALITARCAAEYGRLVFAVPGEVTSGRSRGCHELIRDGAFIADSPDDVLFALGLPDKRVTADSAERTPSRSIAKPALKVTVPKEEPLVTTEIVVPAGLSAEETRLWERMDGQPRHLDELGAASGLDAAQAGIAATMLEMKALIRRLPGNLFTRAR